MSVSKPHIAPTLNERRDEILREWVDVAGEMGDYKALEGLATAFVAMERQWERTQEQLEAAQANERHLTNLLDWRTKERDEARVTLVRRDREFDELIEEGERLEEQYQALRSAAMHAELCMFAHEDDQGQTHVSLPIGDWLPVVEALQAGDSIPASVQNTGTSHEA